VRAGVGKLQLDGISLVESSSKLGQLKTDQLPGQASQAINTTIALREDKTAVAVNIRIKLDVSYDGDKTRDPAVSILASFVAHYSIVEAFPEEALF